MRPARVSTGCLSGQPSAPLRPAACPVTLSVPAQHTHIGGKPGLAPQVLRNQVWDEHLLVTPPVGKTACISLQATLSRQGTLTPPPQATQSSCQRKLQAYG